MEKENRIRNEKHLKYVRSQKCMIKRGMENCNQKAVAHHLLRAQEGAMGMKTGDNWTIPLCNFHHDQLHRWNEKDFFLNYGIEYEDVLEYAQELLQVTINTTDNRS